MDNKTVIKVLLVLSANGYDEMTVLDLLTMLQDGISLTETIEGEPSMDIEHLRQAKRVTEWGKTHR